MIYKKIKYLVIFLIFSLSSCNNYIAIADYDIDGFSNYYLDDHDIVLQKMNDDFFNNKFDFENMDLSNKDKIVLSSISQISNVFDFFDKNFDDEYIENLEKILKDNNLYLVITTDNRLNICNSYDCRKYYENIIDFNENVDYLFFDSFYIYNDVLYESFN